MWLQTTNLAVPKFVVYSHIRSYEDKKYRTMWRSLFGNQSRQLHPSLCSRTLSCEGNGVCGARRRHPVSLPHDPHKPSTFPLFFTLNDLHVLDWIFWCPSNNGVFFCEKKYTHHDSLCVSCYFCCKFAWFSWMHFNVPSMFPYVE